LTNFTVTPYTQLDREPWNDLVHRSKNATFLFDRNYMEYHADRFTDASLLVRSDRTVVGLFPANRSGGRVVSHGGLTYGGMLLTATTTIDEALQIFDAVLDHYADAGAEEMIYKTIPSIYHAIPAEEDRYALFLHDAKLIRRDILSVVDYRREIAWQERRIRSIKKARQGGLGVDESRDFQAFWPILANNLSERYAVAPVHSVAEIECLAGRFPENIRLFGAFRDGAIMAGAVVYLSKEVCHMQYNAANAEGKAIGALDAVLADLVDRYRGTVRYFDFGVSTEKDGQYLNRGLVEYKEGFGSRSVVHDFYRLDLKQRS
jgi:hypothetical protein